jgi:dolichol-phosphate mannosyltransferase
MRVLVVVPTYNERENIDAVVERTLAHPAIDLLVVDDGSPDGTGVRADQLAEHEPRLRVIHRASKNGLGPAYRHGLGLGMDEGYELLIEMDADLSHDPAVIPTLIERAQHADLVIGSRYITGGGVQNWPWHRQTGHQPHVHVPAVGQQPPVRDATSGFRAFRREVLEEIGLRELRSDGYSFQLETALQTWLAGFHIDEAPIIFIERVAGQSKISRGIVFEAMARVLVWAVRCLPHRVRGNPRNPRSIKAIGRS